MKVNLKEFVSEVLQRNGKLTMSRLDAEIAEKQIDHAKGDFEPRVVAATKYRDEMTPNTVEESMQRSFLPEYYERSKEHKVGLKKKIMATGAQLEVESGMREINNTLQTGDSTGGEFKTFEGVTLTQPLLKGFGSAVTSNMRLASGDAELAKERGRLSAMELLGQAAMSYLDLCWSKKVLDIRQEAADVARKLLVDGEARAKAGRTASSELLEYLALVSQREAQLNAARQALISAEDALYNHLFMQRDVDKVNVETTEALESEEEAPQEIVSLEYAFTLRPELRIAKKSAAQEDVRIVYLANQKLPQLDLVTSYGFNGLAHDTSKPLKMLNNDHNKVWSIGLQFDVPLFGGVSATSQWDAAKKRKERALLDIKNTEVQIANMVHTQMKQVENGRKEWKTMQRLTQASQEKWKTTLADHKAGRGEYRDLLHQESLVKQSQEAEVQSLLRYRKALVSLYLAEGSMLARFGAEALPRTSTSEQPDATPVDKQQFVEVWDTIQAWAEARTTRDVKKYLGFYAPEYQPDETTSRKSWEENMAETFRNIGEEHISTEQIYLRQTENGYVEATFDQHDILSDSHVVEAKSLIFTKIGPAWKIIMDRVLVEPSSKTEAQNENSGQ
ncbi:MAG: TolC family protein [Magnetococcales bacterium]|nr:TolC family protein [Magnetococcales bacterium]